MTSDVTAAIPPSALPGISPSRGEIGQSITLSPKDAAALDERSILGCGIGHTVISPLEGEMPGKAEGDKQANIGLYSAATIIGAFSRIDS
jgi:hypothetical protein